MTIEENRPVYRPDIDGLRAVAVLAVVLFHAFPSVIKGGFVGVDIFFVISGYLITSIILKSLKKDSFEFSDFYSRRIKRIFPALIFVLASCFAFGWMALLPDEYKQLGKHTSSGIGFISNIIYWSESGYFDSSAELKPLLHLWSLGIEEQFYILFPLVIWGSWKFRLNILSVMTVLLITSFFLNVANIKTSPESVFYLLPYRAWELAAGGILAYFGVFGSSKWSAFKLKINSLCFGLIFDSHRFERKNVLGDICSVSGVLLIALAFYLVDDGKRFPGWWAVMPVLGAVLVIAAGKDAWLNRIFLSNGVVVWFGLISFPFYLWHWPLLVFPRLILGEVPSTSVRLLAVVAAIFLSWVTYRFVEKSIRHSSSISVLKILFFAALVFVAGALSYKYNGFPDRSANTSSMNSQFGWNGDQKDDLCQKKMGDDSEFCRLSKDRDPTILLVGDSISWQYYFGLEEQTRNTDDAVLAYTHGGCAAFFGFSNRFDFESCLHVTKRMLDLARNDSNVKTIVFSSFPRVYSGDAHPLDLGYGLGEKLNFASESDFNAHVDKTFSGVMHDMLDRGKNIVFIKNNPHFTFDLKNCVVRPFSDIGAKSCDEKYSAHVKFGLEYNKLLDGLIEKFPDIKVMDPADFLCSKSNDSCSPVMDGKMLYRDVQHLSKDGSKYIGEPLYKLINQP